MKCACNIAKFHIFTITPFFEYLMDKYRRTQTGETSQLEAERDDSSVRIGGGNIKDYVSKVLLHVQVGIHIKQTNEDMN
jgi:hypothetical protein